MFNRKKGSRTLGVKPLKKAVGPSFLMRSFTTVTPETLRSKLAFWIRVLTVSRGAATVMDATAPAIEAMKFWPHVAFEKSETPSIYSLVTADAPKSYVRVSSDPSVERKKKPLTAKLPGALRAMVHPHPRYRVVPSSMKMRMTPRPRKASGFT